MIVGAIFSILAGVMIAIQGILNARLGEKIGLWHTNTLVHGTGFLVALVLLLFNEKINFAPLKDLDFYYILGGAMGVVIVFSVMRGISDLGASYAITILIVAQIITTVLVNYFGFFGETMFSFSTLKVLGLLLMVGGMIIYQLT